MLVLDNPVQPYAWGTVDGLARLVGRAPTGGPEAELWVGAHPAAPSTVADGRSLDDVVGADLPGALGPAVAQRFDRLPFLLKVLAIGRPLSLQAHPSAEQAAAGFAREEAAGVAADDPARTYRDPWPKPEMLVALEPTSTLCGFRDPAEARGLLTTLDHPALRPLEEALAAPGAAGTRLALAWLLRLEGPDREAVAHAGAKAVANLPAEAATPATDWVARLADAFPGDPGCLAPLLLNLVELAPGEAVHLPAGNLHAYLSGAGVELMAASDNVLRGGLTPKHVDVDELLAVLRFEPGRPPAVVPRTIAPGVWAYDPGEPAFALTRHDLPEAGGRDIPTDAPALYLATGGTAVLTCGAAAADLAQGRGAFVPAGDPPVRLAGHGTVWRATVGGTLGPS